MAAKPVKKSAVKASASPKKSTTTSKPTVRGGPGTSEKNVSKQARNPTSTDKAYMDHKKKITEAQAQYKQVKDMMMVNPLERALSGGFGKYDGELKKLDEKFKKLTYDDNYFIDSGYASGFGNGKSKKK
jgi:hypothetical protein